MTDLQTLDPALVPHDSGLAVEEMYVERGKLDDVFREITMSAQA